MWSDIISAIGNQTQVMAKWKAQDHFAVIDQPFDFSLRTSNKAPEIINGDGSSIPLVQNPDLIHLWNGTTYPRNTGWNQLRIEGDSISINHFYATDSTAWNSLVSYQTIPANKRFFNDSEATQVRQTLVLNPINPIWFFAIFLLCMGWLWFEPKLFGS